MRSLRRRRAPDECGRGATADAVALMRPLGVVVMHEAIKGALQGRAAREVASPEHHAPEFLEDRALQPFDEAVGPGVARFGPRVPQAEFATGDIKLPLELGAAIGQHAPHRPARPLEMRYDDLAQERGGGGRVVDWQQPGQAIGRRRIARRDLPDLADAFEVADVEGVQAHELTWFGGLDVPRAAVAGPPQLLAGPFGQQPGGTGRLLLEDGQSSSARGQADPAQQPLHRAGRQAQIPGPGQIGRDPATAPRRGTDRDAEDQPLDLGGRRYRTTRLRPQPAWMQPVAAVAFQPLAPAIEQRARDPQVPADSTDVAHRLRPLDDAQAHSVYALVQGHRSVLPQWFPWPGKHSGKDRADGLPVCPSQVSTLIRVRTP